MEPTCRQQRQQIPRHGHGTILSSSTRNTTTTRRWLSVVQRDATVTTFVYAVLTTRIYCRANCPARLARRANVRFYDDPRQAEEAGFRACKRCNPQFIVKSSSTAAEPGSDAVGDVHPHLRPDADPQVQIVRRACQSIQKAIVEGGSKPPRLHDLAQEARFTAHHFHRVFKKVMGVTPGRYAAVVREWRMQNEKASASASASSSDDAGSSVTTAAAGATAAPLTMTAAATTATSPEELDELDFKEFVVDDEYLLADSGLADLFAGEDTAWWNDFDWMIAAENEYLAGCYTRESETGSLPQPGFTP